MATKPTKPTITRIDPRACCPRCAHPMDAVGSFEGARPSAGDDSVCLYCGTYLRLIATVEGRLTVRQLTDQEEDALDPEERAELQRHRAGALQLARERRREGR